MAKVILEKGQKNTPDDQILGKDWYGKYQITLEVKGTTAVYFQRRVAKDKPWQNASCCNGSEITLTKVGAMLDVNLIKSFDYRCVTETAGSEVWIGKHQLHDS